MTTYYGYINGASSMHFYIFPILNFDKEKISRFQNSYIDNNKLFIVMFLGNLGVSFI